MRSAGWPDALLLNGGVFRAAALAARLRDAGATGAARRCRLLDNAEPDLAVARGAVAYALARRGLAPRIGGGSARSYYLLLDDDGSDAKRGICVLPRGSEEGQEVPLEGRTFALRVGEPVRFHLVATTTRLGARRRAGRPRRARRATAASAGYRRARRGGSGPRARSRCDSRRP